MNQRERSHKSKSSALGLAGKGSAGLPWWLRALVILGASLLAAGGIIALVHPAMLASPHDEINGAVRIYAGYLASRNLVLSAMLLAAMGLGARAALGHLMLLTAFIQVIDGCIDCVEARWAIVPEVLILGLLFLFAAARLSGYPFWKIEAWRQGP